MTYQAWITCEEHFMSRQDYAVFWIRKIQRNCIMSLYTAKQVNISICWFSKELKPNEWIQRVEAAIIIQKKEYD
jgi:dipeptide/tripeptide permease